MAKRITLPIFIDKLAKLKNPPTIVNFDNYNYQHAKLSCHCNICNTDYAAIPKKILRTSVYGCPTCYRNMKLSQTARMNKLSRNSASINKRLRTFTETNCCKQGAEKTKQTKLLRYGSESYCNADKIKQTKLVRYGDPTFNNHPKSKITLLQKYGVEYLGHIPNILDNQKRYKNKPFTFPSGNIYNLVGYEPIAVQKLLDMGYTESDLLLKNRPSIQYFWSANDGFGDNKWHRYHPDIIVISENKIIEVKSIWTYSGNNSRPDWLSKNLAKQQASINAGYKFEFWIL